MPASKLTKSNSTKKLYIDEEFMKQRKKKMGKKIQQKFLKITTDIFAKRASAMGCKE